MTCQIREDRSGVRIRAEIGEDQISGEWSRAEIREETSSAKNQKTKRERGRISQVASSGRRYFRLIINVIVNELSNKTASSNRESRIICHGTPDT
jgi:hypothetical protein